VTSRILSWSDTEGNGHLVVAGTQDFREARAFLCNRLLATEPENYGKWQSLDISESSAHATYELLNTTIWYEMPQSKAAAQHVIKPDLPWAENHFQERVAGKAVNPGVEHANWPYHAGRVELHQNGGKYDHNYMERFWPTDLDDGFSIFPNKPWHGYRFRIGDLDDVVRQLHNDPGTRQAYLPIFFPEDTGATQGQRVPCTLGYHFIIRDGKLHLQYNLRSCEIYRHFTNDVYMAVRLADWVRDRCNPELELGQLTLHIVSLHGFVADTTQIEKMGEL
jgi:thymidylate synthase